MKVVATAETRQNFQAGVVYLITQTEDKQIHMEAQGPYTLTQ
jgi:hypothetical protein